MSWNVDSPIQTFSRIIHHRIRRCLPNLGKKQNHNWQVVKTGKNQEHLSNIEDKLGTSIPLKILGEKSIFHPKITFERIIFFFILCRSSRFIRWDSPITGTGNHFNFLRSCRFQAVLPDELFAKETPHPLQDLDNPSSSNWTLWFCNCFAFLPKPHEHLSENQLHFHHFSIASVLITWMQIFKKALNAFFILDQGIFSVQRLEDWFLFKRST